MDAETARPLVDLYRGRRLQKGSTGKWDGADRLDLAVPVTAIGEATFARHPPEPAQRAQPGRRRGQRLRAHHRIGRGPASVHREDVRQALFASKIVAYCRLRRSRSASECEWGIDGALARIWRAGCIIRAAFLDDITCALRGRPTAVAVGRRAVSEFRQECIAPPRPRRPCRVPIPVRLRPWPINQIRATRLPAALSRASATSSAPRHPLPGGDKEGVFHTLWAPIPRNSGPGSGGTDEKIPGNAITRTHPQCKLCAHSVVNFQETRLT